MDEGNAQGRSPEGRGKESDETLAVAPSSEDLINQASEPDETEGVATAVDSQIPKGVSEVVTPSGIQIYYQAVPKRLYKVDGIQRPSVTEVDVLEKGGLPWWGMKVGIEGFREILEDEFHKDTYDWERWIFSESTDDVVQELISRKLTVNHVRDQAGDRGESVHKALEAWAEKGIMPHPAVHLEEEQGYVQGLRNFLTDSGAEAVVSEVMVGSIKHKYAGRYDLDARIPDGAEVFVHITPKGRGDRKEVIPSGLWRLDLKTSGSIYPSHYIQIEAYEEAAKECGYGASDHRGVLRVTSDGRYELKKSKATFADFKAVLGAYRALERVKAR